MRVVGGGGGGGGDLIKGLCVGASTEELPGGLKVSLLCSPMQRCLAPLMIIIALKFLHVVKSAAAWS